MFLQVPLISWHTTDLLILKRSMDMLKRSLWKIQTLILLSILRYYQNLL